jgi:hypothetical protein
MTFRGQLKRLKSHKDMPETGLTWMKETLFQPLIKEQTAAVYFHPTSYIRFFFLFRSIFLSFVATFCFINPGDLCNYCGLARAPCVLANFCVFRSFS